MIERFLKPFFSGVFFEPELAVSSRTFEFIFRAFALGDTALPGRGMGEIPAHLAARLPQDSIRTGCRVERLGDGEVRLALRGASERARPGDRHRGGGGGTAPRAGGRVGTDGGAWHHLRLFRGGAGPCPGTLSAAQRRGSGAESTACCVRATSRTTMPRRVAPWSRSIARVFWMIRRGWKRTCAANSRPGSVTRYGVGSAWRCIGYPRRCRWDPGPAGNLPWRRGAAARGAALGSAANTRPLPLSSGR